MDPDKNMDPDEPPSSIIDRQAVDAFPGLEIDIDIVDKSLGERELLSPTICRIVYAVLCHQSVPVAASLEVFVRVIGNDDSRRLNSEFRGKNTPTNVLSFPGYAPNDLASALAMSVDGGPPVMLGDIVVAAPVVIQEAAEQGKPKMDHFGHLVAHGLLHLLGYDHIEDTQAEKMEAIETVILSSLGISNPYLPERQHGR